MPLATGTRLGNYEILGPLGKGGMGEVYRAKDTKLDREVAVKVLPADFAQHPDSLARFEREAKVLAALNHPNIASIHAVEESAEGKALVMELVPGETLRGPVPLDTALKYAEQIASALEAAHDRGIVHRDLKPGNIMLTPEGVIKVLDFGLAMVTHPAGDHDPDSMATMTISPTRVGTILGTAAYMSPEQARGKPVDSRADIWAFGVVLYEMLTGRRLFEGETVSDVLAAVIAREPDLSGVPPKARRLVQACLEKDPKRRLRDIRDMWRLLVDEPVAPRRKTSSLSWLLGLATAVSVLAALGVGFVHFREIPPVEQTQRFGIAIPESSVPPTLALSPDGKYLAIAGIVRGKRQLWLRPMDALQAQPVPFTDDASYPFWSPDGRAIGFFAQGKLKRIAASGGPSQILCDAPEARGGSWSREDVILFAPFLGSSIQRVAAAGGVPTVVTRTGSNQRHPVFLPDGRRFLYFLRAGPSGETGIYVASLDGKENRPILPDASSVTFAPPARSGLPAHLLFVRENTLMAAPFDASSAQLSGDVFPVADGVAITASGTYAPAVASENGVLIYDTSGTLAQRQIAWADRTGKLLGRVGPPGPIFGPALSPDEKLVAYERGSRTLSDIWARDLVRGTETRLTSDRSANSFPFWSPKEDRIVFRSDRKTGVTHLYVKAVAGGQDELLLDGSMNDLPTHWSQDGRFIVYARTDPKTRSDLWVLSVEGPEAERKPVPFLQSEFIELDGKLSPDSHWMAFSSNRSGRDEIYVRPFPRGEGEYAVSIAGGGLPRWRGDGKEIFFVGADGKMMSAPVKATLGDKASFEAGAPTALFAYSGQYDVTADGKRFLILTAAEAAATSNPPLTVVTNWQAGVKK